MQKKELRIRLATLALLLLIFPALAMGGVPPRFYWKSLMGTNAVPVIYQTMSGNVNPLDPAQIAVPGVVFDASLTIAGFAKLLPVFDRAAMLAVLVPMGRVTSTTTVGLITTTETAGGYGDPLIEFDINLIGPDPIMNIPDMIRYEPGFSLDLLIDLGLPLGEYDASKSVNIGQNRFYTRIATPIVWQMGRWVPGWRTTLEFLPNVYFYGDNDEFQGTGTLETDPMYGLETHLTTDFTEHFWGSLDLVTINGGKSTINGVAGSSVDSTTFGYTLGYQVNDNMQLTFGYMATIGDSDPGDIQLDGVQVSLVYGWHPLIEGMGRLGE
jgi:hypothetical protein